MSRTPIVSLEIGTTTVRVLIGEPREDGHLMITGIGTCPARGIRKGEIVDFENALECVRTALKEAEDSSEVIINEVHLQVSGGHISSLVNRGSAPIMDDEGEITSEDIDHAMDTSRAVSLPPDRETIHTICQHFFIDDETRVINPEGMEGHKLAVDMLIIHGVRTRLRNTVKVLRGVPMDIQDVAFSGLCAALGVLEPAQKESGVTVIDLGGGTTDYVIYARNSIAAAGSLAVGGDHITNDLSRGLRIPISQAERAKEEWGNALVAKNAADQVVHIPPDGSFPGRSVNLKDIQTIISLRLEETFGMIKDFIIKNDMLHTLGSGVVLTGGGAHMKSIVDLAENVFELPCHIGVPRNVSGIATAADGPEFAAPIGMLRYGIKTSSAEDRPISLGSLVKRIFQTR